MHLNSSYDWIISVGGNCSPAWNIRRSFGQPEAFPFDWWISDYFPTLSVLNSKFANMFEEDEIRTADGGTTVVSSRYWIKYHHDFRREAGSEQVSADFQADLESVKKKYSRRVDRLFGVLNADRVLFVRQGLTSGTGNDIDETKIGMGVRLFDALTALNPQASCDLLVINGPQRPTSILGFSNGRIAFDNFPKSRNDGHDWHEEDYKQLWLRQGITRTLPTA